ncbi:MAG: hypothetical protein Q9184_000355 [Pyrenodesmia sp. 2 TL-2023]
MSSKTETPLEPPCTAMKEMQTSRPTLRHSLMGKCDRPSSLLPASSCSSYHSKGQACPHNRISPPQDLSNATGTKRITTSAYKDAESAAQSIIHLSRTLAQKRTSFRGQPLNADGHEEKSASVDEISTPPTTFGLHSTSIHLNRPSPPPARSGTNPPSPEPTEESNRPRHPEIECARKLKNERVLPIHPSSLYPRCSVHRHPASERERERGKESQDMVALMPDVTGKEKTRLVQGVPHVDRAGILDEVTSRYI